MRVIYFAIYSLASGTGCKFTNNKRMIEGFNGIQTILNCSKVTDRFEKQNYHGMKCFNIAGKMQYQNSNLRIQRDKDNPFVQF